MASCEWQILTSGWALDAFRGRWQHVPEPGMLECSSSQPAHGFCPSPKPCFSWSCSITLWLLIPCKHPGHSLHFGGFFLQISGSLSTPRPKNHPRVIPTLLECPPSLLAGGAWSRKVLKGPWPLLSNSYQQPQANKMQEMMETGNSFPAAPRGESGTGGCCSLLLPR